MLVARIIKDQWDVVRHVIDMRDFMDIDETITQVRFAEITPGTSAWSLVPFPPDAGWPELVEQYETTPLLFKTWTPDRSNTRMIVFLEYGTPANSYTVRMTIEGTSLRAWTVELGVQITGDPPWNHWIALDRGFRL